MPEADWITKCVEEAAKAHPLSKGVTGALKEKLGGLLRERPLRPAELKELADTLLAIPDEPPSEKSE